MTKQMKKQGPLTSCDTCGNYVYDDDYGYYLCEADLDEDEMAAFLSNRILPILSDLEFLSDLIALSPDMHLLSFLNQLIAELRMCNGDDSLAFLPGCKTL